MLTTDFVLSVAPILTLLALAFGATCGALCAERDARTGGNRHRGARPPPLPPPLPNAVGLSSAVRRALVEMASANVNLVATRAGRPI